jgi:Helitron helicase-like domain at N-terminus
MNSYSPVCCQKLLVLDNWLISDLQLSTDDLTTHQPCSNEELAVLIAGNAPSGQRSIIQPRPRDGHRQDLQVIADAHRSWDPMHYVLLYPHCTDGFHLNLPKGKKAVTAMNYYCYKLMQRDGMNALHRCCRLFQKYIVDATAKIELLRLNFIRSNQNNCRSSLADAMLARDGHRAGRRIVLPAPFTGGARYMHKLFQDAMAIVRRYG